MKITNLKSIVNQPFSCSLLLFFCVVVVVVVVLVLLVMLSFPFTFIVTKCLPFVHFGSHLRRVYVYMCRCAFLSLSRCHFRVCSLKFKICLNISLCCACLMFLFSLWVVGQQCWFSVSGTECVHGGWGGGRE